MNLEVILGWHVLSYLCTLLRCYEDALYIGMRNKDFHNADIELEDDGTLDIHDDAHVIIYLQTCEVSCEVSIRLTCKECD